MECDQTRLLFDVSSSTAAAEAWGLNFGQRKNDQI